MSPICSNDSIIALVKAGVGEEVILDMIDTESAQFSIGNRQALALKADGASILARPYEAAGASIKARSTCSSNIKL
jgi:hypothetical protein